jgi:Peptidase family S64
MEVLKIGRATGETKGTVNGCVIQRWDDDTVTIEIGVVGTGGVFADVGDSGSLVVTVSGDEPYGLGMLIKKNADGGLGLVSPLWAVLEDVEATLGEGISLDIKSTLES